MFGQRYFWIAFAVCMLVGAPAKAQFTTADTLKAVTPGLVYKEFSRSIATVNDIWRVTDPDAPFVGDPANSPSTYLPNAVLSLTVNDLQGAIKAVAVLDCWGGHVGTVGKQFRMNGNGWIDIPSISNTSSSPECYTHQYTVEVEVPLEDLIQGSNNFEGTSGGQTCYNFGWGQWGWYGFLLRVYYDPGQKSAPTGSITSPVGGATLGANPLLTAAANSAAGISRVDFVGRYEDYDTDGDGIYLDWQQSYHRLKTDNTFFMRNHIGTANTAPYGVTWDTSWVPDQPAGSIQLVARIRDNNGLFYVTDRVTDLTLSRPDENVRLYKATNVSPNYWVRDGAMKSSSFVIPAEDDLVLALEARMLVATWNGINGQAETGQDHWTQVNGWTTAEFGEDHAYGYDEVEVLASVLQTGTNTVTFYSESIHHGAEILWPGPGVVVRYGDLTTGPAVVILQPEDTFIVEGGTGSFSVRAGGDEPLSFQWQRNGVDIVGAQSASYTTLPVTAANDGDLYRCVVSNDYGSDTSEAATLNVLVPGDRNTNGQIVLYGFGEGGGNMVNDQSGVGTPANLVIDDPGAVSWLPGALSVNASTVIASAGAAAKVHGAVMVSNEISIEAWIQPANLTQNGPARIVSLSSGLFERNFTLGQGVYGAAANVYEGRMRTTTSSLNGTPALATPVGDLTMALTHVVFTRSTDGTTKLFVNGVERSSGTAAGNLSNWDASFQLGLANEISGDRPWLGEFHLVALFDRALPMLDVLQNFAAGPETETTGVINATVSSVQALGGPVTLFALPDGSGNSLQTAQWWSGVPGDPSTSVDASIAVQLVDGNGAPVAGFPADKIRVVSQSGGWVGCPVNPLIADGPTDATGTTTISGVLHAGGQSSPGELLLVVVDDPQLASTSYPGGLAGLEYFVNSADMAGDLAVDLLDLSEFASIFFGGEYDASVDFVWDGAINLTDVGKMGVGFGVQCPAPAQAAAVAQSGPPRAENSIAVVFESTDGDQSSMLVPGQQIDAFVVLQGPAARSGIGAFDARIRVSENVVVHRQDLITEGINLGEGTDMIVGLVDPQRAKGSGALPLVHLRVSVTDDQPAYFWVEGSRQSGQGLPMVAANGELHAARPVSGDMAQPVASLNDADFALGTANVPTAQLSLRIAPNPFNPQTEIRFRLPANGAVDLRIFDTRGQLVATLRNEVMEAGEHRVVWNGTDRNGRTVASGVYFSRLNTESGTLLEKMMLMK